MHKCFKPQVLVMGCLLACGMLSGYGVVNAQPSGYHAVADLPAFKEKFKVESQKVLTIQSSFTQEKVLTALTEKITSTGKFWFKRSNKVRLEYIKPYVYLLVINGDKVLIRDDQQENRINASSNKLFQQVNRIMIDCVQGSILDSKDFTAVVFENENTYRLVMTPTSKTLREFFKTIALTVDKSTYAANRIEMNEPAGDTTTILFTDKILNHEISDSVFTP